MRFLCAALLCLMLSALSPTAKGADLTYNLDPQKIADGVYAFIGSTQHFNRNNGGNIVNTGFIVGETGVIVIDTGPSALYGREMRAAIRQVTPKPVTHIILTHHHPDHIFGTQAFVGAEVLALAETRQAIDIEGEGLLENMYHMVGDWMLGTELIKPTKSVLTSKDILAGRSIQFIPFNGHTAGDLTILDEKTGVLFAGDLVFHNRTATTPHAVLSIWIDALDNLADLTYSTIVPGHGPVENDGRSIRQTRDYLVWLQDTLQKAVSEGMEMTEVMRILRPIRFNALSLDKVEYHRSIAHLWPSLVEKNLPLLDQ
ncbi:quinoprotein relay system zinc metallohydrolase 1 [Terasakiella sp. A23]|uniref:quinoprotein relay system zinc metallohydrolase 1 n=1 Tax=Terasakiella sp. FCG-A23 TaxID=3080561 RepID=UPI002955C84A|nr:quinoprotein relay system zinc metallohydrolase 1 [Terasakiella sp. A23]MDV7339343.1 quinoprotein relay system zinc metallohydrolase 1 [Terasakiella sp. A23]